MNFSQAENGFVEKIIRVNDINMSILIAENNKTPLIFLHAFPLDKFSWQKQLEFFKDRFQVIAPDLRGFGKSEAGQQDFSIDLFASDVLALINNLKLEKVILCGLSMGGYIAINVAIRFQEKIAALILCNTHCEADTEEQKKARFAGIQTIEEKGLDTFAKAFIEKVLSEKSSEEVNTLRTIKNQDPATLTRMLKAFSERKATCNQLGDLKMPVLVLAAENDKVISRALSELTFSKLPKAKMEIVSDTGHFSHLEKPDVVNTCLANFLAEQG